MIDSLQPRGDEEQPVDNLASSDLGNVLGAVREDPAATRVLIVDLGGRLAHVGSGFAALLGHAPAELARRPLEDLAHGEDRARLSRRLELLRAGVLDGSTAVEIRYPAKDGRTVASLTTLALLRTASGAPERFVAMVEDRADRLRSDERERLQLVLSAGNLGDWSWDAGSDLVTLGPRAAEIFGLPAGGPRRWSDVLSRLHELDRERVTRVVEAVVRGEPECHVEFRLEQRRNGEPVWIALEGRRVRGAGPASAGVIGTVQDVTERRELETSQRRLAAVVESSDDAIVTKDLDGVVRTWNRAAERIFGHVGAEMIGEPVFRLIPRELHDEEAANLERLRRGERVEHYETVRLTKDGRRIDISLGMSPLIDGSGRVVGASEIARDVTDKKRVEAELRRSEEGLRTLADAVPQLAWIADGEGRATWYNTGWYEYTGTSFADLAGAGWHALHDPAVLPRVLERWNECLRTGTPFEMEYPLRAADGTFRGFLARARPIRDDAGRVVRWLGTCTDVDAVKRAREALAEETRLLDLLNEASSSITADLDLQALLQKVTDVSTQLSGAEFGAFFFNTKDERGEAFLLYTLSGADRAAFERFGKPRATPLFAPTFTGQAMVRCDDVQADPRYGRWGGMPQGHLPVRSYLGTPVVSRSGEVHGGLFFGHSRAGVFTERIERLIRGIAAQAAVSIDNARLYERVRRAAEDRRQLLDAERTARTEAERVNLVKDEFLATLSHELRTPLHAIVGWSQLLARRQHSDPEVVEGLSVIARNARMQAQLIDDLLDMSRIISGKLRLDFQRVDVPDVARAAIDSVRHQAERKGVRLEAELDPRAGSVHGDPSRLQQCFWNLLTNAVKFTPKGGHVRVRLEPSGDRVRFVVADEGQGIAPEFLPHVFERFRQADASATRHHGGLGLGLSIVSSLVRMHGGGVKATSAGVGQGATFSIELPLVVADSSVDGARACRRETASVEVEADHPSLAGVTVLAVDDEPDALGLVKRLLEQCGARVFAAGSARAGLAVLERERPDILVCDISMPEEDGYAFVRRVRGLAPERGGRTPAVALSALARSEDRTRALRSGYQLHIAKPVDPSELAAAVASLAGR